MSIFVRKVVIARDGGDFQGNRKLSGSLENIAATGELTLQRLPAAACNSPQRSVDSFQRETGSDYRGMEEPSPVKIVQSP